MGSPPLRIALTGGIGTGKSHCLERFARLGIPVIDADVLAREALAPGTPELSAVVARFGRAVLDAAGALDRPALARVVFADPTARRDLEAIVHPAVYRQIADWFESLAGAGGSVRTPALGIADIPLLYETGREADFDRVIVATCPPAQQVERLVARGWSDGGRATADVGAMADRREGPPRGLRHRHVRDAGRDGPAGAGGVSTIAMRQ